MAIGEYNAGGAERYNKSTGFGGFQDARNLGHFLIDFRGEGGGTSEFHFMGELRRL